MRTIAYYISGHGYGHATRSMEVMKALYAEQEDAFIYVRTNAPEWIFRLNLSDLQYEYQHTPIDIGAVQNTSLFVDKSATLHAVTEMFETADVLIEQESGFIKSAGADIVVADIPPLAFDIAERAGLPSVAITNFTWDWIYESYISEIPEYLAINERIRSSYTKADRLLRLPMHGDLSVFRQIQDIPLIARKAKRSREDVLKLLGLQPDLKRRIVLIALRTGDVEEIDLDLLNSASDYIFISPGLSQVPDNFINLPPDYITFPELVNACDVAISKPGYGIVSEIIANRTPLLYVARDDFIEYDILVDGLQRWAVSECLPRESFLSGDWLPSIRKLLQRENEWPDVKLDGAEVAASEILKQF